MTERKGSWGRFLLRYALILLLLGMIGCLIFYGYAGVYEETRPELIMDALMADTDKDEWKALLSAELGMSAGGFEDDRVLFDDYFEAVLRDADFSYRRDMGGEKGQSRFVVYTGPVQVATVTLGKAPGSDVRYGLHFWATESIEPINFRQYLESFAVEIELPSTCVPAINGVALTEAERVPDGDVLPASLGALESRMAEKPHFVRYRVDGLCGSVTVTVDGEEITPSAELSDGVVPYFYDLPEKYSFRAEAPEDVTVSFNGVALGAEELTGRRDAFKGLDDYSGGNGYETLLYQAEGLYTVPVLTAVDAQGRELPAVVSEDGTFRFFHFSDSTIPDGAQKAAEDFLNAYMAYSSSTGGRTGYLLSKILRNTELYRYIRDSAEAMYWASQTEVSFNEVSYDNFRRISDDCFSCTIRYAADFTATAWHEQYSYDLQNGFQMVFVRQGGQWLAASMSSF